MKKKIDRPKGWLQPVEIYSEGAWLTRMLRSILVTTGMAYRLDTLVNAFISKNPNGKSKATIYAELTKDEITWKSFIHHLFRVCNAKSINITMDITWGNGQTTVHNMIMKNIDTSKEEDADETTKNTGEKKNQE